MTSDEPEIIINGINCGSGCAMTIRVAIEVFASTLIFHELDPDAIGFELKTAYINRIKDIRKLMSKND